MACSAGARQIGTPRHSHGKLLNYFESAPTFGGKVDGRNFRVDHRTLARFGVTKLASMLDELHQRLAGVVIERLPYADLIRRYDAPGTLFFLDPPYWGCEGDYGPGVFDQADFERLADQLAGIAGQFILTINATAGAREVFKGFDVSEVDTTYTLATLTAGAGKRVKELVVRG